MRTFYISRLPNTSFTDYDFSKANLFNSNVVEIAAEIEAKLNQN